MVKRIAIEGLLLLGALALGALLWIFVALAHNQWIDDYWTTHRFPPLDSALNPRLMPVLTFSPLAAFVFLRLGAWAFRSRQRASVRG